MYNLQPTKCNHLINVLILSKLKKKKRRGGGRPSGLLRMNKTENMNNLNMKGNESS